LHLRSASQPQIIEKDEEPRTSQQHCRGGLLDVLDTEEETHKKWQPLSDCHYHFTVL